MPETPRAFRLPQALAAQGFALRPETEDDVPFLMRLYASTRAEELALVDWTAAEKETFLAGQFRAQRLHYRTQIAGCAFDVIEQHSTPAGRLYLEERETRVHIVDIALLPEWRGQGIGTAMLEALQAFARARGKGVDIFVERFNPALRLYTRLGFVEIGDHGIYLEMEWLPDAAQLNVA